jgi:hypothetical protein
VEDAMDNNDAQNLQQLHELHKIWAAILAELTPEDHEKLLKDPETTRFFVEKACKKVLGQQTGPARAAVTC